MSLLKIIFFTIIIYYAFKIVGKILQPFVFNQPVQKGNKQQNIKQKRKGDVTIYFEDKKTDKQDRQVGEYVDFEEIKD